MTILIVLILMTACGEDEVLAPVVTVLVDSGVSSDDAMEVGSEGTDAGDNTPPSAMSRLADKCTKDSDCGESSECLTAEGTSVFTGGPANGYCSAPCGENGCAEGSTCIRVSEAASYCMLNCTLGTAGGPGKCVGRNDLACASVSGAPVCFPMCGADSDCPDDRRCDLGRGVCVDGPLPAGGPIGAACEPAPENNCQTGLCQALDEQPTSRGVCVGYCSLGNVGCGSNRNEDIDPGEPYCIPVAPTSMTQDLGICTQRCNCNDDCMHPDGICSESSEAGQVLLGARGICRYPAPPASEDAGAGMSSPEEGIVCAADGGVKPVDAGVKPDASATADASADAAVDGDSATK